MTRASLLLLALVLAAPAAFAQSHSGRGVYYFDGTKPCPLAGVGQRGANACNRLALEDNFSKVTVDKAHHKITFVNSKSYSSKTLIGDFLFLGDGKTRAGITHHLGIHLRIDKKGNTFTAHTHSHVVDWVAVSAPAFEPFDVVVSDGKTETSVLTHKEAMSAVTDPKTAAKIMNELVEVRDILSTRAAALGAHPLSAVEVGFGIGVVADMVLRAELVQLDKVGSHKTFAELLTKGSWELKLTSLSSFLPKTAIRHDLFLFGLENVPALASVKANGLPKGQVILFKMENGKAAVGVGKSVSIVPNGADVMRNFLEFGFLGTIMKHQAEQHLAK